MMPKLSTLSAEAVDLGIGTEAAAELGGYKVSYVNVNEDTDLTPLLQGLPDDKCPCPHWGYVFKGRMWWRLGDHEESHEAGDAFFVPGGHTSGADAGSEFVIFSPTEQMAPVDEHIRRRAEELQSAARP
jgi:hypothetical protein